MNSSYNTYSTSYRNFNIQKTDRFLAIYSLLLIIIGTPSNLICCVIYFQKTNRLNSIKTIFGYLALLDTIALYTFNLNYVVREFNVDIKLNHLYNNISRYTFKNNSNGTLDLDVIDTINTAVIKRNLEEYSLFICRFLSYLAFSTLQTSSWVLAFGSFNRFLLVKKISHFEFICKRRYTIAICLLLTFSFFLLNIHILWMNGYRSPSGEIKCYKNARFPDYMLWHQRLHLLLYSVFPSIILFIFNTLLIRVIFESKKRLNKHRHIMVFAATAATTLPLTARRSYPPLKRISSTATTTFKRMNKPNPAKVLYRHSRKLTLSLIFITMSYFTLTFPSTVIFSFFRSYIEPAALRRTISLLFTNLSTTTHAIRFFIYFFCSIDFRKDFYDLFLCRRSSRLKLGQKRERYTTFRHTTIKKTDSSIVSNKKGRPTGRK